MGQADSDRIEQAFVRRLAKPHGRGQILAARRGVVQAALIERRISPPLCAEFTALRLHLTGAAAGVKRGSILLSAANIAVLRRLDVSLRIF